MKLTDYLHEKNLRANAFAKTVGVSPATIGRWLKGGPIDLDAMEHIAKITENAVMPNDWIRDA